MVNVRHITVSMLYRAASLFIYLMSCSGVHEGIGTV